MKGYDKWLDPPDDPPEEGEVYCQKHHRWYRREEYYCPQCEVEIEAYIEQKEMQ